MRKIQFISLLVTSLALVACQSGGGATKIDAKNEVTEPKVKAAEPKVNLADDGEVAEKTTPETVRLDTVEKFGQILDKKLSRSPSDFFYYRAGGRLFGVFSGHRYSGSWTFEDGFLCRKITSRSVSRFATDCQVIVKTGNQLKITREKGNGQTLTYTIAE